MPAAHPEAAPMSASAVRSAICVHRPNVLLLYTDQQRRAMWTTGSGPIQKGMPHSVIANMPCAPRY